MHQCVLRPTMTFRGAMILAVVGLMLTSASSVHAQFGTSPDTKARNLLNRNHKFILFVAQTGATLKNVSMNRIGVVDQFQQPVAGHFALRCTYTWESALFGGPSAYSTIDFLFDRNGNLYRVNDAGKRGTAFANFAASQIVLDALREEMRKQLQKTTNANDRAVLQFLINNSQDPRAMLEGLLKMDQVLGG